MKKAKKAVKKIKKADLKKIKGGAQVVWVSGPWSTAKNIKKN